LRFQGAHPALLGPPLRFCFPLLVRVVEYLWAICLLMSPRRLLRAVSGFCLQVLPPRFFCPSPPRMLPTPVSIDSSPTSFPPFLSFVFPSRFEFRGKPIDVRIAPIFLALALNPLCTWAILFFSGPSQPVYGVGPPLPPP